MVPEDSTTSLGMEYFCSDGDDLWNQCSEDLIRLAAKELELLKLAQAEEVSGGFVHREPYAYPVYDSNYQTALAVIREFLARFGNLQLIGRNGLHKYNNQDHSMICARLAVANLMGAKEDLWAVNSDSEYQESF
jgi:protoporphyrinogen oxidase